MPLYHFSEDPTIAVFVPRTPLARPEVEPLVWAIDDWNQPKYFAPRDCPRVCFWPGPETTATDRIRFWSYVPARMVVAIEAAWFERLHTTQLYRYVMPEDMFERLPQSGGAFVSRATLTPLRVEPLGNLVDELIAAQVELRICQSLVPLADAIIASTMEFSLIRMRNAQGWIDPKDR